MRTSPLPLAACAALVALAACRTGPEPATATAADHGFTEAPAAPVDPPEDPVPAPRTDTGHDSHADHGGAPQAPADPAPNRDLHGPADTERYIEMLASERRVAELKPELVTEKIVATTGLARDAVVADLGCGPGIFAWPLARAVPRGHVLAVDVEPRQLDALRAGIAARAVENVVPVLASYETPHLPPGGVDVVFLADTYHHVEERVAYFRDLRAALRPGGHLVVLEYKDGDLPIGPPADHKVPRVERHAELTDAGYELVTELSTHIWHDFEFWRLQRAAR